MNIRKKWLLVLPIHSYRGAERVAINLAEGLAENGHQVYIFFVTKDSQTAPVSQQNNIKILYPPELVQKLLQNPYIYTLFAPIISLIYLVKVAKGTDIIQTESYPCFFPSLLLAKIYKKKIGWIIHDINPENNKQANFLQRIFSKSIINFYKYLAKYLDLIITVSPKTYGVSKQLFPNTKIEMVLPPVNFSRLDNPSLSRLPSKKILLTVGAIHPLKNQALAITSLSLLKKEIQRISLLIVGGGDPSSLTKLAKQYNLSFTFSQDINIANDFDIIFTGFAADNQINNYYSAADLVLISSLSEGEGLNITGFEALYLNKLSITTPGAGIAQIFTEHQIGLVSSYDPVEYATQIKEVISNPAYYEKYIQKGRQYLINNLSVSSYATKIINVYSTI
jgi:glycosyltransferase involved in cell wall biosynthesis